ncbi:MAG: hypothetical protein U5K84_06195 [Alkalibacterium sp.]|nr:hypothetical protein [Alkalibacterium sp.]
MLSSQVLIIFPALFAYGLDPAEGAGLVFIVLPTIFEALGGIGVLIGLLLTLSSFHLPHCLQRFHCLKYPWHIL